MTTPVKWFAGALGVLQPTQGDGTINFDTDGSIFIERVWKCLYTVAFDACPRPRADAPPGTPGISTRCISSSITRAEGDSAIVKATYQGIWTVPFTVYQMDAGRYEKPIQQHPRFNNQDYFPTNTKVIESTVDPVSGLSVSVFKKFRDVCETADDEKCKFRGVEAYMIASATWRKTSYQLTPDASLTNIFKLDAPETGGVAVPDSGNAKRRWLKADKTCRNMFRGASQIWEIQESWLYNENGWLSAIYS